MPERAESAPAGRLDSAPLGRQQKQMNGERPIPVLPRQATKSAAARIKDVLRKPPLIGARNASTGHTSSTGANRDNSSRTYNNHIPHSPYENITSVNQHHQGNNNKRRLSHFQSDPLADRCSIALGRTESILVSAAGDVLVCRCRRSSMPYIATEPRDPLNPMILNLIPCCEADCGGNLTSIEGPWSPVFDSLTVTRQISSAEMSQTSDASVYEWEANSLKTMKNSAFHQSNQPPTRTLSPFRLKSTTTPTTAETSKSNQSTANLSGLNRRIGSLTIQTAVNVDGNNLDMNNIGQNNINNDSTHNNNNNNNNGDSKEQESRADVESYGNDMDNSFLEHLSAGDGSQLSPAILPLPSFDYSHIHEGHNDMLNTAPRKGSIHSSSSSTSRRRATSSSQHSRSSNSFPPTILESAPMEEKKEEYADDTEDQKFLHGVPVFLTHLSQIRVRMVSAHPLGAHVMLISEEALLFTYGLNNHGQLGIGVRSNIKDETRGFHKTPTLVTPLLENGGKTIHCAAGVDHSLVVVATEGRRLHKIVRSRALHHDHHDSCSFSDHGALRLSRVTSQPAHVECVDEDDDEADSVQHHQVYGFGCNEFMKIGLVSSAMKEDRDGCSDETEEGDILLPHRVALHCSVWPSKNDCNTSHFPPHGIFEIAASAEHSAALVRRPTGDIEVYTWGNATLGALGVPIPDKNNIPMDDSVNSKTKSRSSSNSHTSPSDNIFPLPTVVESLTYRPHKPSSVFPRSVSLGPYSSFVLLSNGKCMSFGYSAVGMLGHGYGGTHSMKPEEVFLPNRGFVSVSAGAFHVVAIAEDGQAYSWGINSHDRLGLGTGEFTAKLQVPMPDASKKSGVGIEWVPQCVECPGTLKDPVIRACAGYDCSMLVTSSGQVYSFGKRSGKLGKGELVADVSVPEPLYGGLRLFHNRKRRQSRTPKKNGLARMDSEGNLQLHGLATNQQDATI